MAEEDWTIVPKLSTNKWQEEEDEEIKENWDDEEEDEQTKSSSTTDETQKNQSDTKSASSAALKGKKKNKFLKEKIAQREVEQSRPKTAEEIAAERREQQRLVEESDLNVAKDTFGVSSSSEASAALASIRLATREDFDEFKKALDEKLNPYVRSPYYANFLENLFRSLASSLESDDVKKINTTLTTLYNEKIKLQKQSKGKKPKKKDEIRLERDDDFTFNQYNDDFDDFM